MLPKGWLCFWHRKLRGHWGWNWRKCRNWCYQQIQCSVKTSERAQFLAGSAFAQPLQLRLLMALNLGCNKLKYPKSRVILKMGNTEQSDCLVPPLLMHKKNVDSPGSPQPHHLSCYQHPEWKWHFIWVLSETKWSTADRAQLKPSKSPWKHPSHQGPNREKPPTKAKWSSAQVVMVWLLERFAGALYHFCSLNQSFQLLHKYPLAPG